MGGPLDSIQANPGIPALPLCQTNNVVQSTCIHWQNQHDPDLEPTWTGQDVHVYH